MSNETTPRHSEAEVDAFLAALRQGLLAYKDVAFCRVNRQVDLSTFSLDQLPETCVAGSIFLAVMGPGAQEVAARVQRYLESQV